MSHNTIFYYRKNQDMQWPNADFESEITGNNELTLLRCYLQLKNTLLSSQKSRNNEVFLRMVWPCITWTKQHEETKELNLQKNLWIERKFHIEYQDFVFLVGASRKTSSCVRDNSLRLNVVCAILFSTWKYPKPNFVYWSRCYKYIRTRI